MDIKTNETIAQTPTFFGLYGIICWADSQPSWLGKYLLFLLKKDRQGSLPRLGIVGETDKSK